MSSPTLMKPQKDPLSTGLAVSVGFHVLIVAIFVIKSVFIGDDKVDMLPAIRVDLVALPDKVMPTELPPTVPSDAPEAKAPPAPEPQPTPPPPAVPAPPAPAVVQKPVPEAINLEKTKARQKEALAKLKSLEALDRIKDDVKKERTEAERRRLEAIAAASRAQAGAVKIKGNRLATGADLIGIDKLEHEQYRSALDHHVKQFWQLPEWLARKSLVAQVVVRIDQNGRVLSKRILRTSTDPDFDNSVLETIDRAAPLPAPPEKFVAMVGAQGILMEFGK